MGKEPLLYNSEGLSSDPRHPHRSWAWPCAPRTPVLGSETDESWVDMVAEMARSELSEETLSQKLKWKT